MVKKEKTEKAEKAKTVVKKEVIQVAYIGPSIQNPVQLQRYTTFKGGLPKDIQAFLKGNEKFRFLFVDVKKLSKAMSEISNSASLTSIQIKKAMESLKLKESN